MDIQADKSKDTNISFRIMTSESLVGMTAKTYIGKSVVDQFSVSTIQNLTIPADSISAFANGDRFSLRLEIYDPSGLILKRFEIPVKVVTGSPLGKQQVSCSLAIKGNVVAGPSASVSAGMRLYDEERKCWWHQVVSNGEFVWVVEG